jgi:hypothetical protein
VQPGTRFAGRVTLGSGGSDHFKAGVDGECGEAGRRVSVQDSQAVLGSPSAVIVLFVAQDGGLGPGGYVPLMRYQHHAQHCAGWTAYVGIRTTREGIPAGVFGSLTRSPSSMTAPAAR